MSEVLQESLRDGVLHLTLARPEKRNALDETLISLLRERIDRAGKDHQLRALVLKGEGKSFCAGADISYMRRMADYSFLANVRDAQDLGGLFLAISDCPKPVVARVHGAAIGGGAGLVAAADIALAAEGTKFAFSEVRLGIVPGVISPFVLRRLGAAAARRLFLTGQRIDVAEALRLGLVDEVHPLDALDDALDATLGELNRGGPQAQAKAKQLLDEIHSLTLAEAVQRTPEWIARQRATEEAREGFAAFLEKRPAEWVDKK